MSETQSEESTDSKNERPARRKSPSSSRPRRSPSSNERSRSSSSERSSSEGSRGSERDGSREQDGDQRDSGSREQDRRGQREGDSGDQDRSSERGSSSRRKAGGRQSPMELARSAARQFRELAGRDVEGVTALERTEDGWSVQFEVVEARRIPDSADILALYDVDVDDSGTLMAYRRVRRYPRGQAGEG